MKKKNYQIIPLLFVCCMANAEELSQSAELSESLEPTVSTGFYGSVFAGIAIFGDGTVDVQENTSGEADFEINDGLSGGLRLGYDFGQFRLEGEYTRTFGDIEELETSTGAVEVNSEFVGNSLLINGLIDIELDAVLLSLGAGVGVIHSSYDIMQNGDIVAVDDSSETVLGYQGIIRASYSLSEDASVGVAYRYFSTADVSDSGLVHTNVPDSPSQIGFDGVAMSIFEIFISYDF